MNIGKYSIIYVCLNEIVIMFVGKIVSRMNMSLYLSKILILLISLFVLSEIGRFFLKLKNRGKIKAQSMERSIYNEKNYASFRHTSGSNQDVSVSK